MNELFPYMDNIFGGMRLLFAILALSCGQPYFATIVCHSTD